MPPPTRFLRQDINKLPPAKNFAQGDKGAMTFHSAVAASEAVQSSAKSVPQLVDSIVMSPESAPESLNFVAKTPDFAAETLNLVT
jgi:hypothetical protein